VVWLRLDNPARRWAEGFVGGDRMYCDKSFTGQGQHRLRCLTWFGNGPVSGAVLTAAQRQAVRQACSGQLGSEECASASAEAHRSVPRAVSRKYLDGLEAGR
jgi:hypothetical protein